ncbi:coiled-coil domain-containing protein 62 isoform X2 [Astyanax mexicanus]|uniref:coiled-coil domain-containing protein 62 isoform X2 n=1 Tax=Astyanax mexicanus TaxID=7994 RepID=UPI0020CAAFF0|nr:coiled-coil domain-containing protein 62 isoform X2 [Astyanax mexicanus]
MDEDRGKEDSRWTGKQVTLNSNDFSLAQHPWHSTPVKKHPDESSTAGRSQKPSNHLSSLSYMQSSKTAALEMEISTIEKQRTELQLLIAELKDRDQELNTMAAAHHSQLQAWEQDRQRVLTLEQRCGRLEDELRKRNEVIRAISKRLKVVEAQEKDSYRELSTTRQRLQELTERQEHSSQQRHSLEETNQSLNTTIMTLSSQVGQLQVHEEELNSMLKLKDKDLMAATSHILGLTNRLQESETSLKESQERVGKLLREAEEYKRRFREARFNNVQLKDELQEKTIENNSQREELIQLKQENQLLRKELVLAGEGESWKDELLGLARSKQERTESELLCLRQVCEKQQNDLQLLKLNLESSRETLRQYECQRSRDRDDFVGGAESGHSTHDEPEIEESGNQQCQIKDTNTTPESTTATSASASADMNHTATQTLSREDLTSAEEEKPADSSCETPAHCCECEGPRAKPDPIIIQCSNSGSEVDIVGLINCSETETEEQVLVVDVRRKDPQSSSPLDVTCLFMDYPISSPRSIRSPVPVEAASLNITASGSQEEYTSSTSRLKRLLADSQQMVASLERSSRTSLSPTPSPTSHCNPGCSLHHNHNNGGSHNHSQSSTNTLEEKQQIRVVDSEVQSDQQLLGPEDCSQQSL